MHDSVTGPTRSQHHDSSESETHGAEYLQENVKNALRQPVVYSQPKKRREEPKPVSQNLVGEEPFAYEEAYPEPVGREIGHSMIDQEWTDNGSMHTNIVDHTLCEPEQRNGTGNERSPDDELIRNKKYERSSQELAVRRYPKC